MDKRQKEINYFLNELRFDYDDWLTPRQQSMLKNFLKVDDIKKYFFDANSKNVSNSLNLFEDWVAKNKHIQTKLNTTKIDDLVIGESYKRFSIGSPILGKVDPRTFHNNKKYRFDGNKYLYILSKNKSIKEVLKEIDIFRNRLFLFRETKNNFIEYLGEYDNF